MPVSFNPEMLMTRYRTLVSAETLLENLKDPQWIVFDVRHELANVEAGRAAYAISHIPGAIFEHMDDDLSAPKTGFNGRHPLPDREAFAEKMALAGVNRDSQVVVYDSQGGMMAARLWWMLRWIGHESIAVLDGGWPAWQRISAPTESAIPAHRARGNVTLQPSLAPLVTVEQVLANLESRERVIVDARGEDRFRGENETIDPVAGHIPGAINRPFRNNLSANDEFKSAESLHAEWNEVLRDWRPSQVVAQCGSGVTACHNILALEIAGMPGAALYAGSWSEWCADPDRPVARG